MKKCLVVYNPQSGKSNKMNFLNKMELMLSKYGYESEFIVTKYKGHAEEIVAVASKADLIISIGGDGTFNEVMTGNFKRSKRVLLSHIPVGTANDIGAMYGFGKNIIDNLRLVLNGTVKKVDICTINKQPFVYVAGLGKFVNVSYDTPRKLKKKFGYLAYLIEGLKEFHGKTKMYDINYEVDGVKYDGTYSFMLISNANRIAGINNFYKNVKLDDNTFEVLFCNLNTKTEIIKSLYYLTTKDITKVPGFKFYKAKSLKINFNDFNNQSWCLDGEKFDSQDNSFDIKIVNDVELLVPSKNVTKLFLN